MNEIKEPIFKKVKSHFDEINMEYTPDELTEEFFHEHQSFVKDMISEINNKCNKFIEFKYYLKYRRFTIFAMFFILPLMFLLGVIGFTSEAFILSWFFFAFLFFSMFIFFLILYFLSSKISTQFLIYSQQIQEIIDRYNMEWLIERKIFAYFRTKSVDSWKNNRKPSNLNAYQPKQKLNPKPISIKFKFFVQSRLLRIIRNFFWIEFLNFAENEPLSQQNSPSPKKIMYSDSPVKQQVPGLKLSQYSQNSNANNNSQINASIAKSNNNKNINKSGLSYNSQMIQKTPERKNVLENDQVEEQSNQKSVYNGNEKSGEQSNPRSIYKSQSPNVIKFEESSDAKSQIKTNNADIEGVNAEKYFKESDQIQKEEQNVEEGIEPADTHNNLKGTNNIKNVEEEHEEDF